MPLHADYLAPTFLLTLIFVQLFFIIYFNYTALRNYGQNQVIYLTGTDPQCEVEGLPDFNPQNICTVGGGKKFSGEYYINTPQNTYILSKTPQTNISVCTPFCVNANGTIDKSGNCSKTIPAYTDCLSELEPINGCKQAEKPLAKLVVNPNQTIYYYAKAVLTNLNDC